MRSVLLLLMAICCGHVVLADTQTFPEFPRFMQVQPEAYLHEPFRHRMVRSRAVVATAGVHTPYTTFDGASIHTRGSCKYLLAHPCQSNLAPEWMWRVSVVNRNATPHYAIIKAMDHSVTLAPGQIVKLDTRFCSGDDFPCNAKFNRIRVGKISDDYEEDGVYCYIEELHLMVTLQKLKGDASIPARYTINVMILSNSPQLDDVIFYREKMCGLFGNFNNDVIDDVNKDDPEQTMYANWLNRNTCGF